LICGIGDEGREGEAPDARGTHGVLPARRRSCPARRARLCSPGRRDGIDMCARPAPAASYRACLAKRGYTRSKEYKPVPAGYYRGIE